MAGAQGLEPWARGFGAYGKTLKFQYLQAWVTPWVTLCHIFILMLHMEIFLFSVDFYEVYHLQSRRLFPSAIFLMIYLLVCCCPSQQSDVPAIEIYTLLSTIVYMLSMQHLL